MPTWRPSSLPPLRPLPRPPITLYAPLFLPWCGPFAQAHARGLIRSQVHPGIVHSFILCGGPGTLAYATGTATGSLLSLTLRQSRFILRVVVRISVHFGAVICFCIEPGTPRYASIWTVALVSFHLYNYR